MANAVACAGTRLEPPIAMLSPLLACVTDLVGEWWVAQTESRHEKRFAAEVAKANTPYFLPLSLRYNTNRREYTYQPIFPTYVFVYGQLPDSMARGMYVTSIHAPQQKRLVNELENIRISLMHSPTLSVVADLPIGSPCRVIAGHRLEGMEGKIIEHKGETCIVIELSMFKQKIPVEINPAFVELL